MEITSTGGGSGGGADPLSLNSTTAFTTPLAGNVRVIARLNATRETIGILSSDGGIAVVQPHEGRAYLCYCAPVPGSVTPTYSAMPAGTFLGAAVFPVASGSPHRINLTSVATAGGLSYVYWPSAWLFTGNNPVGGFHVIMRFTIGDSVAGARMFVGLSTGIAAPTNVEPSTLLQSIGIAKLAGSGSLQMVSAGSSASTPVDLGTASFSAVASGNIYELQLFNSPFNNTTVGWRVENLLTNVVQSGSFVSGIPGSTVPGTGLLAPRYWRTNNATAVAVTLGFIKFYAESVV